MKIKSIDIYSYDLPVKNAPYCIESGDVHSLSTTLVKTVMDNGVYGWGETSPVGHYDDIDGVKIRDGHIALPQVSGFGVLPEEEKFNDSIYSF